MDYFSVPIMDLSRITLSRMTAFMTVAAEANIARAARMLATSQPSLSRQIAALESDIGAKLFVRNGRGVELTEAGAVFHDHALAVIETMDRAAEALGEATGRIAGEVRLGLPPTMAHVLALPLISALQKRHEGVSVTVTEGYSGHVLEWLSKGRLDIGILYHTGTTSGLKADLLHEEELHLIAPPGMVPVLGEVVTGAAIAGLRMILPSRAHGLRQLVDSRFSGCGLRLEVQLQVNSFATTLRMVEHNMGCTILPRIAVEDRISSGSLVAVPLRQPALSRKIMLATSPAKPPSRAVASLASYARTYAHNYFAGGAAIP